MFETPLREKRTWGLLAGLRPFTEPSRRDSMSIVLAVLLALPAAWGIPILVSQLFSASDEARASRATAVVTGLILCVVIGALASWWRGAAIARLRIKSLHRLKVAALRAIRRSDLDSIGKDPASLDARLSEDLAQVAGVLPDTWIGAIGSLLQTAVAGILLATLAPSMLAAALLGVALIGGISFLTARPLRTASESLNQANELSRSRVSDSIRHESLLRSANAESTDLFQLVRQLAVTSRAHLRRELLGLALGHPIVILSGIFPLALLALWALGPQRGSVETGTMIAAFILMGQLFDGASRVASVHSGLQSALSAVERVLEVIALPDAHPAATGSTGMDSLLGTISFSNVSAGYDEKEVLRDISFTIKPGEHVAVVGRSGSGKSTLLSLLWRAREPLAGSISINGVDLASIQPRALRAKMAILPQDTPLLDRSLRQNLMLASPQSGDADLTRVLSCTQLDVLVGQLEDGLETKLGNRGSRLSGGERARVALGRELLKSPDIVLLDEATSQLDPITESAVMSGIELLTKGRTTFVIAHRMETARRANRVLVLEAGRLVGFGSHDELVGSCPEYQALRLAESMKESQST